MTCCYCKHDLADHLSDTGFCRDRPEIWAILCEPCADELRTHQVVCAVHPSVVFV